MGERTAFTEVVRRGRRRTILQIFVRHLTMALAIAFGGSILVLLLGAQLLNWYWILVLFAGGLAVSAWQGRSGIPSAYQVAQSLDSRLKLYDVLSTAYYFLDHPNHAGAKAEVVDRQRAEAEAVARTIDLRAGLPFAAPRSLYACAALALAACGIFGIRYGILHSLDLKPSLVRIAFDGLMGQRQVAELRKKPLDKGREDARQAIDGSDPLSTETRDPQAENKQALDANGAPDQSDANKEAEPNPQAKAGADAPGNESTPDANAANKNASSKQGNSEANNSNENSAQPSERQNESGSESSSLSSKMRDAIANLLSKFKPSSSASGGKSKSKDGSSQSAQKRDAEGDASEGKPQNQSASADDAQGAESPANEPSDSQKNGNTASNADQKSNQSGGKTGIGKSDGDKTARQAEQLAAMGKLTEIIGKRAQNVSGEVMVEVSSGKQQLQTQYSGRSASHSDAGGDVNRDEVPLAYQQYVQQYFEEIHKAPAAKAKSK